MIILFAIMVMIIGSAAVANIYSLYVPFMQELGDIHLSTVSYYGAVSSLERGMLVLRQRQPGYEGFGGWRNGANIKKSINGSNHLGPASDESNRSAFGSILSRAGSDRYGMQWSIDARTPAKNEITIPADGKGNIPSDLQGGESEKYNMLSYDGNIAVVLGYDNGGIEDAYKTGSSMIEVTPERVTIDVRPAKVANFGLLDIGNDSDGDEVNDDVLLNWEVRGRYGGRPFTILPLRVENTSAPVGRRVLQADRAYRESNMNASHSLEFKGGNKNALQTFMPLVKFGNSVRDVGGANVAKAHYMTPRIADLIDQSFQAIFNDKDVKDKRILITPANLVRTATNIYPFLEYKITIKKSGSSKITLPRDTLTLRGEAWAGPYHTQLTMTKPTLDINTKTQFTFVN